MKHLEHNHDVNLPQWGPYSKKYTGISHIAQAKRGIRYDLSVVPGYYRRKIDVPSVLWESGYHPWEASPNLEYYSFRHELEWKDKLIADISYNEISSNARLIRCHYQNNTEFEQNVTLQLISSIHYPQIGNHKPLLGVSEFIGPEKSEFLDALQYKNLSFSTPRPSDQLVYDGLLRGEQREHGATFGSVIGKNFGATAGDSVSYRWHIVHSYAEAVLIIRYKAKAEASIKLNINNVKEDTILLHATDEFACYEYRIGSINASELDFTVESSVDVAFMLDSFVLVETEATHEVEFIERPFKFEPIIEKGPVEQSLILKYDDADDYYGLMWSYEHYDYREYISAELDTTLRFRVNHHGEPRFIGNGEGHYYDVMLKPIPIEPLGEKKVYAVIVNGSKERVKAYLEQYAKSTTDFEKLYEAARSNLIPFSSSVKGLPYQLGQQLMQSTLMTNIVYPVYIQKDYIRHYTPGKWWDSLYTWDAGFIGLGLLELDVDKAIEVLNTYVTDPGNEHAAYIHHGSPVPVQHYLFLEIWNRTQNKAMLAFFYDRLKQYYLFQSGQMGSSTFNKFNSNLLSSWDYFYNSGGWDDYAPQVYVHAEQLGGKTAPASVTAHVIRIAKILKMAAIQLSKNEDIALYDVNIKTFTQALNEYSWDETAGYYSYVVHDDLGNPSYQLKHESGENFNQGFDGIYPVISGICDEERESLLIGHMMNEQEIFSPIGLTAISQKVPYYRIDGYWNGAVWFSHQWFFWKTLLTLGRADEAFKIAQTALDLWKKETDLSYNCMEHFIIASGRGAGWHQFGALSAPVLNWFNSYYVPGTITAGYEVWITEQSFSEDNSQLQLSYNYYSERNHGSYVLLIHMAEGHHYQVLLNGDAIECIERHSGLLELTIPHTVISGHLVITNN